MLATADAEILTAAEEVETELALVLEAANIKGWLCVNNKCISEQVQKIRANNRTGEGRCMANTIVPVAFSLIKESVIKSDQ